MLSWKPAEEESYKMNRHWLCASCIDSFEWIWMHNPIKCSHTNSSLLKSGLLQDSIWNTSHQQLDAAAWFAPLLTFVIAGEKMWPVFFLVFFFLFSLQSAIFPAPTSLKDTLKVLQFNFHCCIPPETSCRVDMWLQCEGLRWQRKRFMNHIRWLQF